MSPPRWLTTTETTALSPPRRPPVDPCCPLPLRLTSRGPLQPTPFSDRYGPYRTPQTRALVSMAIFSTGVWMLGIFFFRQTLKLLLSYHGWMFEMHGRTSRFTKVWAVSRSWWRASGIWLKTLGASFGVLNWRGEADGHWCLARGLVLVLRVWAQLLKCSVVCFHPFLWLPAQHSLPCTHRPAFAFCPAGGPCSTASRHLYPSSPCPRCQPRFSG